MVLSEFSISVVLDLQQIARELEELLAFGRLLGIRMEGTLAAVGEVSAALTLDGGVDGREDHGARSALWSLEEELLEHGHRCGGRVLEQIRVHNARMHHVDLHVRLFRIQQRLQMAGEQNLGKLRLAVGSSWIVVFPTRK